MRLDNKSSTLKSLAYEVWLVLKRVTVLIQIAPVIAGEVTAISHYFTDFN